MLIAFIAFLACFELPRGEEMFGTAENAWLSCNGEVLSCRIAALSISSVKLVCTAGGERYLDGSRFHLYLERLGWIDVSTISRSGRIVLARLQLDPEQRRRLVARLFSASHGNIADKASLRGALFGLARRGFRGS